MDCTFNVVQAYFQIAIFCGVAGFFMHGVPEIRQRTMMVDRHAPAYQHLLFAILVSTAFGLAWPWVLYVGIRKFFNGR